MSRHDLDWTSPFDACSSETDKTPTLLCHVCLEAGERSPVDYLVGQSADGGDRIFWVFVCKTHRTGSPALQAVRSYRLAPDLGDPDLHECDICGDAFRRDPHCTLPDRSEEEEPEDEAEEEISEH